MGETSCYRKDNEGGHTTEMTELSRRVSTASIYEGTVKRAGWGTLTTLKFDKESTEIVRCLLSVRGKFEEALEFAKILCELSEDNCLEALGRTYTWTRDFEKTQNVLITRKHSIRNQK